MRKQRVKKRMANGEWRMGVGDGGSHDQPVQRPARLARSYGPCRSLLCVDTKISEGRTIWPDVANSKGLFFYRSKHSRRAWPREHTVIHSVSSNRARISQRSRNAFDSCCACSNRLNRADRTIHRTVGNIGAQIARFDQNFAGKMNTSPHSPFAIRHSRIFL